MSLYRSVAAILFVQVGFPKPPGEFSPGLAQIFALIDVRVLGLALAAHHGVPLLWTGHDGSSLPSLLHVSPSSHYP